MPVSLLILLHSLMSVKGLKRLPTVLSFLIKAGFLWDDHLPRETADAACLRRNLIPSFGLTATRNTSLPGVPPVPLRYRHHPPEQQIPHLASASV